LAKAAVASCRGVSWADLTALSTARLMLADLAAMVVTPGDTREREDIPGCPLGSGRREKPQVRALCAIGGHFEDH
jgi:hypothetical protein